jgi:hypothetical protein
VYCRGFIRNEGILDGVRSGGYWNGNGFVYSGVGGVGKKGCCKGWGWNSTCNRGSVILASSASSDRITFVLL